MNISENVRIKNTLSQLGICDEQTICVINHFSHNVGLTMMKWKKLPRSISLLQLMMV